MGERVGDMRVWHNQMMHDGTHQTYYYSVDNIADAIHTYKAVINADLSNPLVVANAFGLEIVESNGPLKSWVEFYDEAGRDIDEIILEAEEEEVMREWTDEEDNEEQEAENGL